MLRVAGLEKQRFTLRSSASQEDGELCSMWARLNRATLGPAARPKAILEVRGFCSTATEEPLSGQYTKDLIFIDFTQMIQL